MGTIIKLSETQIKKLIESTISDNNVNYMFFSNLEQIKRQCEMMLKMDPQKIDEIIQNGHDWADDHISEAKTNIDQVFDFLKNETSKEYIDYEEILAEAKKNKPTNPELWSQSLSWANSKYKVCPSAYCNAAAAKRYKSKGGGWRKSTNENLLETKKKDDYEIYHNSYTSAINDALDYAEKKGYEYDKDETFSKIGMGKRKPKEGDTNRISITLKKDGKEQKKQLHIQVYGMNNKYELNCYIN